MADHKVNNPLESGADTSRVPGRVGREARGAGTVFAGQSKKNVSPGVNFHPSSAHFNPDPRKGVGQSAPHNKPTL